MPEPPFAGIREVYAMLDAAVHNIREELKGVLSEMHSMLEHHEGLHEQERNDHRTSIRWYIGIALTIGGLVGTFLGHILDKVMK